MYCVCLLSLTLSLAVSLALACVNIYGFPHSFPTSLINMQIATLGSENTVCFRADATVFSVYLTRQLCKDVYLF